MNDFPWTGCERRSEKTLQWYKVGWFANFMPGFKTSFIVYGDQSNA